MLFIAVFVSVLSVTSATSDCRCAPPLWEGKGGFMLGSVTQGRPNMIQGLASISYSVTDKKLAAEMDIYYSGSAKYHMKIIQDFNKEKQYTITTVGGQQKCMVTPTGPWIPPCVPSNATTLGDSYYGAGDDILNTTSYSFKLNGMDEYLVMTKKECIPVAESFTGNVAGTAFMLEIGFQGATLNIKDPSVFDVPAICNKAPPIPTVSPPIGVFRLRRSVY